MELFAGSFKLLAPCCDVTSQNWVKKTEVCISCTTDCKNIKVSKKPGTLSLLQEHW